MSNTQAGGAALLQYQPQAITILATYRCTAECENCCFDSNPRIKGQLSLDDIRLFIDQAAEIKSVELIGFSGGECFLLGSDLTRAVEHAAKKGLRTRCVTNGFWAKSLRAGRDRLRELRDAGLSELNVSTGDFHQRYVDQETVVNAAALGVELGLAETLLVVEMHEGRRATGASVLSDPRVTQLAKNSNHFHIIESPWMPMKPGEVIPQNRSHMLNRETVASKNGCRSVLTTMVLTPHRKLGFCCGLAREYIPELNAAYDRPLREILVEHAPDFMKIWLFVDGPEKILAWAAEKVGGIDWEDRYSHQCHACVTLFRDERVRQAIHSYYIERVSDVLMRYDLLLRKQEAFNGTMHN